MPETVLDHLLSSLCSTANISRAEQVRPAAVLWTDHEGQWQGVAERLRPLLPELLILGDYAPAERRGPAIWIKCMLARTLDEADWPDNAVPILYLPGVSRTDLRAIQLSKCDVLEVLAKAREAFTTDEWKEMRDDTAFMDRVHALKSGRSR
ncbi:MAG: hypothetical protein K9L82_00650 [Chromatiaceae bacterium]|nr:hypothetical protein [Chromatiaceae bacterium]MCF7994824.1 hypothetical protein [Chromatiaceae bacterium]MCF8015700.1 hypothetical protein [Chromatiaceae bacterium]